VEMDRDVLVAIIRAETVATLILWGMVLYHYGSAARLEWIQQGGRRGKVIGELLYPFLWAWREALGRIGVMRVQGKGPFETYTPYTPGVILRFAIFAAALGPALSSFRVLMPSSGPAAPSPVLLLVMTIFGLTNFGALMHLYVAYRTSPVWWMWTAVLFTIWCVAGPLLFLHLWPF
jgi:hypothetical protein